MPLVAALAIAVAGFLALRPPAPPPADAFLDALAGEDLSLLIQAAAVLFPADNLVPEEMSIERHALQGAVNAGWVEPVGAGPDWNELDIEELEQLHDLFG
jgi:hypothetical protein